jgi:hypothetical protein
MKLKQRKNGTVVLECTRCDFAMLLLDAACRMTGTSEPLREDVLRLAAEFSQFEQRRYSDSANVYLLRDVKQALTGDRTMDEDHGVKSAWVKYYDGFGRCWEDHGMRTVAEARAKWKRLLADDSVAFAQFGAHTADGSIVLGEYRKHQEIVAS